MRSWGDWFQDRVFDRKFGARHEKRLAELMGERVNWLRKALDK